MTTKKRCILRDQYKVLFNYVEVDINSMEYLKVDINNYLNFLVEIIF